MATQQGGQMTCCRLEASAIETVGEVLHDSDACTVHRARLLHAPSSIFPTGPLALKRIKISNNAAFTRYESECAVLARADHPCIVKPVFFIQVSATHPTQRIVCGAVKY